MCLFSLERHQFLGHKSQWCSVWAIMPGTVFVAVAWTRDWEGQGMARHRSDKSGDTQCTSSTVLFVSYFAIHPKQLLLPLPHHLTGHMPYFAIHAAHLPHGRTTLWLQVPSSSLRPSPLETVCAMPSLAAALLVSLKQTPQAGHDQIKVTRPGSGLAVFCLSSFIL